MSVAVDFVPVVPIPERARRAHAPSRPLADVVRLHPLVDPAPVRLTRRGVTVLAGLVVAVAAGLLAWAAASAPAAPAAGPRPASVTVAPGDTLWSIATRVAPQRDPRAEIVALERANHLASPLVLPGQVLRVP
jgi:LysM repeat protein